jgi:aminoglycoside phosphotransferase (APT) family kinase protein
MIRPDQWPRVLSLLDRVDRVLVAPGPDPVIVHGDLHGYNLVWDGTDLAAVCDLEGLAVGDPSFELRYLPDSAPTQAYIRAVLHGLRSAGHGDDIERALAWHVLTRLGDARWRTLAGIDLPGGGRPAQWVDELFATLVHHATVT